jgi:hypothetical protein
MVSRGKWSGDEFVFDGSWRDIYILGTDIGAWQRMVDGLRVAGYELSYFCNGQPMELPSQVDEVLSRKGEHNHRLSVRFCGMLANCHFFTPDEIEFDIDPREVAGQNQLDGLFAFMECLAISAGRDCIFCPESCPKITVFLVRPGAAAVEYRRPGGE